MLILTDKATNVIRSIAERPEYPDTAGLRIAASSGGERLSAAPAESPEIGDQILDNGGARVFLGSTIRCSTPSSTTRTGWSSSSSASRPESIDRQPFGCRSNSGSRC